MTVAATAVDAAALQARVVADARVRGAIARLALLGPVSAILLEVAPKGLRRVFYSDSGATAVEIALKQSFQYWQLRGQPKKQRFLCLDEAYHGDTLGALDHLAQHRALDRRVRGLAVVG